MNKKQLDAFRKRLLTMEVEINTLLGRTTADSKPVDLDLPIGRLSRADAIQMQNMAELNRRQLEIKAQAGRGRPCRRRGMDPTGRAEAATAKSTPHGSTPAPNLPSASIARKHSSRDN